jgi:hypothetical protein
MSKQTDAKDNPTDARGGFRFGAAIDEGFYATVKEDYLNELPDEDDEDDPGEAANHPSTLATRRVKADNVSAPSERLVSPCYTLAADIYSR